MRFYKAIKLIIINMGILIFFLLLVENFLVSNLDKIKLSNNRYIKLYEHKQNQTQIFDNYNWSVFFETAKHKKNNIFSTDIEGYIIGPNDVKDYDKLIYFTGGSAVECMYVDQDKRFPYKVQENLRKIGEKVKTINAGVGGTNSYHGYLSLITKGMKVKPDIIFLMYNGNDISLLSKTGSYHNAPVKRKLIFDNKNKELHVKYRGVFGTLRRIKDSLFPKLWRFIREYLGFDILKYPADEFKNYRNLNPNNADILDNYRKSIQNYISFCKTNNIRLILMSQFNRIENKSKVFVEDYNKFNQSKSADEFISLYKEANSIISKMSIVNNIEFVDLNNLVPKTPEYIYDMIHLTDKGSLLVSEIITDYLKKTSL